MVDFAHQTVESLLLGRSMCTQQLQQYLQQNTTTSRYRDALHIACDTGEAWLFDYGVMVCWGIDEQQQKALLAKLADAVKDPLAEAEREHSSFELGASQDRMHSDHIQLSSDNMLARLAVSHALAQSQKLIQFESRAQQVIESNEYIPESLARDGKIPLNRKNLAKLRGILFSVKSDIMLNFNLLDTPEFFWEYPEFEAVYLMVARYLDINSRVSVLNKKLETIHELLEMLASEQNHKHSSLLEWIIIVLIAIEIVLFFIE